MSFRTPWKAPVKAGAVALKKTVPNSSEPASKETEPSNKKNVSSSEDSQQTLLGNEGFIPTPSSPEGSNCAKDSEDIHHPGSSDFVENSICSVDTNHPHNHKIFKTAKSPKQSESSKDSGNPEDGGNVRYLAASEGSEFPDSTQNQGVESTEILKCVDVPKCSDGSKNVSINESSELCKPSTVSKIAKSSDFSKQAKLPKLKEISTDFDSADSSEHCKNSSKHSKTSRSSSEEEEDTTLSETDGSSSSTVVVSQANSRGSQFLSQEPRLKLSLPPAGLDPRARLAWIQRKRDAGVWVYCDMPDCNKQRYLADIHDPSVLPDRWYCQMNPDPERNSCEAAELPPSLAEEEDMIMSMYTGGSLVWAKLDGFPEWPAMVDDDPDLDQYYWLNGFSNIPTEYHVTFFDSSAVTRAWLKSKEIRRFTPEEATRKLPVIHAADYAHRMRVAHAQAVLALPLRPLERLRRFGFAMRFSGNITTPELRRAARSSPRSSQRQAKKRGALDQRRLRMKRRLEKQANKKRRKSQKGRQGQKRRQNRKELGSDITADMKQRDSSSCSSDTTDQDPPPSKKPRPEEPSKTSSQPPLRTSPTTILKKPFKSPAKVSQEPKPAHGTQDSQIPASGTSFRSQSQASRKLWVELDSSSESEEDSAEALLPPPALDIANAEARDILASIEMSQDLFDRELGSEDSTHAVAGSVVGSVVSTILHPQPELCQVKCAEPLAHYSLDFIDNTPLPQPLGPPIKAATLPSTDEQSFLETLLPIPLQFEDDIQTSSEWDAGLSLTNKM